MKKPIAKKKPYAYIHIHANINIVSTIELIHESKEEASNSMPQGVIICIAMLHGNLHVNFSAPFRKGTKSSMLLWGLDKIENCLHMKVFSVEALARLQEMHPFKTETKATTPKA